MKKLLTVLLAVVFCLFIAGAAVALSVSVDLPDAATDKIKDPLKIEVEETEDTSADSIAVAAPPPW